MRWETEKSLLVTEKPLAKVAHEMTQHPNIGWGDRAFSSTLGSSASEGSLTTLYNASVCSTTCTKSTAAQTEQRPEPKQPANYSNRVQQSEQHPGVATGCIMPANNATRGSDSVSRSGRTRT